MVIGRWHSVLQWSHRIDTVIVWIMRIVLMNWWSSLSIHNDYHYLDSLCSETFSEWWHRIALFASHRQIVCDTGRDYRISLARLAMANHPQLRLRHKDLATPLRLEQPSCPDLLRSSSRQISRAEAVFRTANQHDQLWQQLCLLWCWIVLSQQLSATLEEDKIEIFDIYEIIKLSGKLK